MTRRMDNRRRDATASHPDDPEALTIRLLGPAALVERGAALVRHLFVVVSEGGDRANRYEPGVRRHLTTLGPCPSPERRLVVDLARCPECDGLLALAVPCLTEQGAVQIKVACPACGHLDEEGVEVIGLSG